MGEAGPGITAPSAPYELLLEAIDGRSRIMELDRGSEAFLDETSEAGKAGNREGGCWRMRRSPEVPSPCSCSVMTGDLKRNLR